MVAQVSPNSAAAAAAPADQQTNPASAPAQNTKDTMSRSTAATTEPQKGFFTTVADMLSSLFHTLTCSFFKEIEKAPTLEDLANNFLNFLKQEEPTDKAEAKTRSEFMAKVISDFMEELPEERKEDIYLEIANARMGAFVINYFTNKESLVAYGMAQVEQVTESAVNVLSNAADTIVNPQPEEASSESSSKTA